MSRDPGSVWARIPSRILPNFTPPPSSAGFYTVLELPSLIVGQMFPEWLSLVIWTCAAEPDCELRSGVQHSCVEKVSAARGVVSSVQVAVTKRQKETVQRRSKSMEQECRQDLGGYWK
jgi:hypothetical protein